MNKEVKAKWVEALRSGEYEQGKQRLRDGKAFCCLGVLTDLYAKEHNLGWDVSGPVCRFEDDFLVLPPSVKRWADIRSDNPQVIVETESGEQVTQIASLNDDGYTFEQLANIIEDQL